MIKRIVGLLAVMMVLGAWAAPALAADQVEAKIISIGLGGSSKQPWGRYREGSWLPIKISLRNGTGEMFTGKVAIEQNDSDGDKVVIVSREINIEPKLDPTEVWLYCWPRPDDGRQREMAFTVEVMDKNGANVGHVTAAPPPTMEGEGGTSPSGGTPWIRKRDYDYNQAQRFVLVLGPNHIGMAHYRQAAGGVVGTTTKFVESWNELPERSIGLDGVDMLVWEADDVHLSDMREGQKKMIEDWVRAGGQLVITGGRSLEIKGVNFEAGFLPLEVTGRQDVSAAAFRKLFGMIDGVDRAFDGLTLSQMTGTPAADATTVDLLGDGKMKGLVYCHNAGVGVVSVITVNLADLDVQNNDPARIVKADQWLRAWQTMLGWSGKGLESYGTVMEERNRINPINYNSIPFSLDDQVSGEVDFYNQTTVRMLMAALFLGLYWVVAGPAGAAVLRYYKLGHWGWWIFGATVLAASGAAMLVVSAFRLERVDLKHHTLVMGRANSTGDVSIVSYYGIFAPVEGQVALALPESVGLAYLAPFCPQVDKVEQYADPQQYVMDNASPLALKVPFRSTLKKMQARWTGPLKMELDVTDLKVEQGESVARPGAAKIYFPPRIAGRLVNKTGYRLHDIEVVIPGNGKLGVAAIPDAIASIIELKDGDTFELAGAESKLLHSNPNDPDALGEYLGTVAQRYANEHATVMSGRFPAEPGENEVSPEAYPVDFLNVFMEHRAAQRLGNEDRLEFERQLTRLMDRSGNLRTSRAIVIAHAGSDATGVPSPLPVSVSGNPIVGTGDIIFTWVVNP